ncbi:general stress protein [Spongiactinospora sp. TRM90649]|uniref:general stress protein n=1 Tax=Spongiactinospora sp. TRM90649 TaxID=3031114 RepID=UPI0023F8804E|nr:general stress protein [Spongiactinospora sp. TRM90649]MDF5755327.1 hypothetical protein [Spongiactinospora sp. TRM90649]
MTAPSVGLDTPVVVDRRLLVSYDNYASAQRTVDKLSDTGFPVEHVSIVGSDLRLEETVTGRVTNARAALTGAGSGVLFGAIVGLFLGLFTSTTASFIVLVLWAALWGSVLGAAFGFINHAFQRGQRDFASRNALVAGRYDVMVAAAHLERARAVLTGQGHPGGPDGTGQGDTVRMETPPTAGTYGKDGTPVPYPRPETGDVPGRPGGPAPEEDRPQKPPAGPQAGSPGFREPGTGPDATTEIENEPHPHRHQS